VSRVSVAFWKRWEDLVMMLARTDDTDHKSIGMLIQADAQGNKNCTVLVFMVFRYKCANCQDCKHFRVSPKKNCFLVKQSSLLSSFTCFRSGPQACLWAVEEISCLLHEEMLLKGGNEATYSHTRRKLFTKDYSAEDPPSPRIQWHYWARNYGCFQPPVWCFHLSVLNCTAHTPTSQEISFASMTMHKSWKEFVTMTQHSLSHPNPTLQSGVHTYEDYRNSLRYWPVTVNLSNKETVIYLPLASR
jgi:hypothetical protein